MPCTSIIAHDPHLVRCFLFYFVLKQFCNITDITISQQLLKNYIIYYESLLRLLGFIQNLSSNSQYRNTIKCNNSYMCLSYLSNPFPFCKQSNSNLSLLNSGFHNLQVSSDINIFPDGDLISIQTPFNDSYYPVAIDSKYCDVNDFNKLKIKENLSCNTLS